MGAGLIIGKQIIIMFIILALGVVCNLKGLITKDGTKTLSVIELNIVNPVLIFMSYQTDYEPALLKGLMWAFLLSAISFAAAIPLSTLARGKTRPRTPKPANISRRLLPLDNSCTRISCGKLLSLE